MCECLSYDDGSRHLCAACAPAWEEGEARLKRMGDDLERATVLMRRARECIDMYLNSNGKLKTGFSIHIAGDLEKFLEKQDAPWAQLKKECEEDDDAT